MSIDFKANQIRTSQIIASGSTLNSSLVIYGKNSATNFSGGTSFPGAAIGTDIFLYVSGALGKRGVSGTNGTTVLGGDAVVSGSLYALRSLQASGSSGITGSLVIKDDTGDTAQLTISSSAGSAVFDMYQDGNLYITNQVTSGQISFGVTQPDTAGSQVIKIYPQNNGRSLTVFNEILAGESAADPIASTDTNFFVNGLLSSKGTNNRGTAVFGGDLVVSGTIYNGAGLSYSVGGGSGGSGNWNELSPSPRLNTTASVAIAGGLGTSYSAQSAGSDVFFFVSGSIGGKGTSGTTVTGGDLVTSGSLYSLNGNATVSSTAGSSTITLTSAGGSTTLTETNSGNLEIRNTALAGQFLASVKTSNGVTCNFLDVRPNGSLTGSVASIFPSSIYTGAANPFNSSDTTFFVAGKSGAKGGNTRGTAVFGGDTVISGSAYLGTSNTDTLVVNGLLGSDIIPDGNRTRNLGSDTARFANVYTGDLHLKNERGDYTLIEEEDCLTIRFNKTGKRYKFVLERAPEFDE